MSSSEENDCPLCLEEIEIDDKHFRPCPCGYELCRFCWNHIKTDLNGLCPACRRPYDDANIEFRPVTAEELKSIKAGKKKREREKREMEVEKKNRLVNVRVVQKNLVYVLGLPIFSEETLRSMKMFGQYGKISKVVVNKRGNLGGNLGVGSHTGVYITFLRKEDALMAIEQVDGTEYEGKTIRATFGTTKYCSYFLKAMNCQNVGCQFLHENGEDAETYLKEEARLYNQRSEKAVRNTAFATLKAERIEDDIENEVVLPVNDENYPSLESGLLPDGTPTSIQDSQDSNPDLQRQPDTFLSEYTTPFEAGYTLIPRYTGLFDPFGGEKLIQALLGGIKREEAQEVEQDKKEMKEVGKSRYEELFEIVQT